MVQFTWISDKIGSFDFFYLPFQRKRSFGGEKSRLRFSVLIDEDDISYESDAEEWHQDFALRWSHYFGIFDIGLSHFYGTGREPQFNFEPTGDIVAYYPIINQTGLDLQITDNAFLWKLETIYRTSDELDFFALAVGLEYTFSNINDKGLDIGLLAEYHYDDRDDLALSSLDNDIFIGSRIAFNDTQDTAILFGGMFDLAKSSKLFSVEASRRLGSSTTIEIEARILSNISQDDFILSNFKNDSFLRLSIAKYF